MTDPTPPTDLLLPALAGYEVFRVPAMRATKPYRCPGCDMSIDVGQGHVVAWPTMRSDDRRHWHHHCWRTASRRGRTV